MALAVADAFERHHNLKVNRDYLIAAAILQDASKVVEFERSPDGETVATDLGRFYPHAFWAAAHRTSPRHPRRDRARPPHPHAAGREEIPKHARRENPLLRRSDRRHRHPQGPLAERALHHEVSHAAPSPTNRENGLRDEQVPNSAHADQSARIPSSCPACSTASAPASSNPRASPPDFLSGAGISEASLGLADVGILGFEENLRAARSARRRLRPPAHPRTPIPATATRSTSISRSRGFEGAGLAGLMIEDQVWPKRCGHMKGKEVISAEEGAAKIRAAAEARRRSRPPHHVPDRRAGHPRARRGHPPPHPLRRGRRRSRPSPTRVLTAEHISAIVAQRPAPALPSIWASASASPRDDAAPFGPSA